MVLDFAQKFLYSTDLSNLTQFQQDTAEAIAVTFIVANIALFLSIIK